MRLLHTADWHIGQTLNGWPRDAEHAAFLAQLGRVIVDERVDALLVAGDVFDGINPSGEAQRMLYAAMAGWLRARPGLQVVMIAGNHDPAARLEAPQAVLRELGVHVAGTLRRGATGVEADRHLVPLRDAAGDVAAVVLAVPFLRLGDLPVAAADAGGPALADAVRAVYADLARAAAARAAGAALVGMGHLTCVGGVESEGAERRILIGGEAAVPPDVFPPALAYVALGHLHRPQSLDGGRVRYAGSPFPLSASEIAYDHGVTLLDLTQGIAPRHLSLSRPAPVLRLPPQGAAPLEQVAAALEALRLPPDGPPDLRPLLYLALTADRPATAIMSGAEALAAAHPVRVAGVQVLRDAPGPAAAAAAPSLADTTPEDLFLRAFRDAHGVDPGPRHLAAFRDVLAGV
jgi:exonuclease SbcD